MLRMQLMTDFLRLLARENLISDESYVEIHQFGNQAINGMSDTPFEDVFDMLKNAGVTKGVSKARMELALANSSVLAYSPWLSAVVPERDRLGRLEVRYDPRDISRVYVRDPETRQFRPVERRDGQLTSVTLWEHQAERTRRRAANHRSSTEKVALRREIAAIVQSAKPSRRQLHNAVRNAHASAAEKPYAVMQPPTPPPAEHPARKKNRLPVEDW
jgi:hypothetical protein